MCTQTTSEWPELILHIFEGLISLFLIQLYFSLVPLVHIELYPPTSFNHQAPFKAFSYFPIPSAQSQLLGRPNNQSAVLKDKANTLKEYDLPSDRCLFSMTAQLKANQEEPGCRFSLGWIRNFHLKLINNQGWWWQRLAGLPEFTEQYLEKNLKDCFLHELMV